MRCAMIKRMASFYIRGYGKNGRWSVMEESRKDGRRLYRTLPKMAYESFGINSLWDIETARQRIKEINRSDILKEKKMASAENLIHLGLEDSLLFPKRYVDKFPEVIEENSFGSVTHRKKLYSHWAFVAKMIKILKIEPQDYCDNKEKFYKFFIEKSLSVDYVNKLIGMLNTWGEFVSSDQGRFFKPVPKPRGVVKSRIADQYFDSHPTTKESNPLKPNMLKKEDFSNPAHYNWLFISLWFGLRPIEVTSLKLENTWRISPEGFSVYQSKLVSLKREDRWKTIPILFPEQMEALRIISFEEFTAPNRFLMKKVFKEQITLYGGRKGFVDLMFDRKQGIEDISMWMGHQSIDMTWGKYRNRKRVSWKTG